MKASARPRRRTTPGGSPPRERILGAAAELFAERGFGGTGVDEIARRAGVNKAMLYYHVGDKEALYSAVLFETVSAVLRHVTEEVAAARHPREKLRAIPAGFLAAARERPGLPRLMLAETADGGKHLSADALATMARVIGTTRSVLEEGQKEGVFRSIDPMLVHLVLVGSAFLTSSAQRIRPRLEQTGIQVPGLRNSAEELADFVSDLLVEGLLSRKHTPPVAKSGSAARAGLRKEKTR